MIFNPFKPHKVLFSNGKYGIRRWNLGWEYMDLRTNSFWWNKYKEYFTDCMTEDPSKLSNVFILITEKVID